MEFFFIFVALLLFGALRADNEPSDNDWWGQSIHGTHQVIYPDGLKSQRMNYSNASNYAEIFGGKVIRASDNQ